ncbi:hypothetical protein NOR_00699 [Metarhizium rileyi]|uniref:Uncharacterized protein n=1 Tax=Metarhizium rileyi (strain RCEF 4871) TaxID=1649241 RepID=A0A167KRW3_METRR|nr:hypothetical protein NOR_00699 [Metarhizium rileyi RCEF 4871]
MSQDQRYARTKFGETVLSAPAFEIRWRSKDLSRASPESGSPLSDSEIWPSITVTIETDPGSWTSRTTETVQPTAKITEPTTNMPQPDHGDLSKGAVGGIATGSVLAILFVLASVVLLIKKRRGEATRESGNSASEEPAIESHGNRIDSGPLELSSDAINMAELAANRHTMDRRLTTNAEASAGHNGPHAEESALAELPGET